MTSINTDNLSGFLNQIHRVTLGFDPVFHDIENRYTPTNYPPYNVIKIAEGELMLEIAIAGFKKDEIGIEQHQSKLTITGKKEQTDAADVKYHHHGISTRSFKLSWTLAEHVEVSDAVVEDGILTVNLFQNVPEKEKPRLIDIA